jgi:hypothetical protein
MRGALRCGGKCAAFGRDDVCFGWVEESNGKSNGKGWRGKFLHSHPSAKARTDGAPDRFGLVGETGNGKGKSGSLRDDKQKNKQRQKQNTGVLRCAQNDELFSA